MGYNLLRSNDICIFLWTALDALFFSCWEFTRAYVLFGCISLARVFILRVAEFSLSSYRSSKYFLAVDFIILRESFSINFCLCFLLPQGRRQPNPQDICFTCGWPGHWSKTCNVPPYKYKQPSQLKPSPRPTGQQQFPWPSTAGQSNPK